MRRVSGSGLPLRSLRETGWWQDGPRPPETEDIILTFRSDLRVWPQWTGDIDTGTATADTEQRVTVSVRHCWALLQWATYASITCYDPSLQPPETWCPRSPTCLTCRCVSPPPTWGASAWTAATTPCRPPAQRGTGSSRPQRRQSSRIW